MIAFGAILQDLRSSRSWSQAQLAKRLNISASQIANYEMGRRFPSLETLISVSRVFGVSTDYLLGLNYSKKNLVDISDLSSEEYNSICSVIDCFRNAHKNKS